jgi:hypothetical protein
VDTTVAREALVAARHAKALEEKQLLAAVSAEDRVAAAQQRREAAHTGLVQTTQEREAAVAARHQAALQEKRAAAAQSGVRLSL